MTDNYVMIVDSASDLPIDIIHKYNLHLVGLKCNFNGIEYVEDEKLSLSYKELYSGERKGIVPTTSQVNSYTFYEIFENYVKEGRSIIYPAFSSILSGTYNSAIIAKNDILSKYPNADITIIDTKCASLGYGLLIVKACELRETGNYSKNEIIKYITNTAPLVNHYFLFTNLYFLKKGGRLSGTAATIGSILHINPLLRITKSGKLISYSKSKGKKKGFHALINALEEQSDNIEEQGTIAIAHSDCLDDANCLAKEIQSKYNVEILIRNFGFITGTHTGPDTIALYFIGKERLE